MKKIISLALLIITVVAFSGCAKEVDVPVDTIMTDIKGVMQAGLIAEGVPEDSFVDGEIPRFMQVDLLDTEAFNPQKDFFDTTTILEGYSLQHMMNVKSDLIIVIKATDKDNVVAVQASLEKIKEQQVNVWSNYLPDQYEKVQNNVIKTNGNYLIYITSDYTEDIEKAFDKFFE